MSSWVDDVEEYPEFYGRTVLEHAEALFRHNGGCMGDNRVPCDQCFIKRCPAALRSGCTIKDALSAAKEYLEEKNALRTKDGRIVREVSII